MQDNELKPYDLVIASNPKELISTTNEAIKLGYVPRGGVIDHGGMLMQSIYLPKIKRIKK